MNGNEYLEINKNTTLADVKSQLADADSSRLAVIMEENQALTLVTKGQLDALDEPGESLFGNLLRCLPPLIVFSSDVELVEDEENYQKLLSYLNEYNAPGIVVYENGELRNVISLEELSQMAIDGGTYYTGDIEFICRNCRKPYTIVNRRSSTPLPRCPKYPFIHGWMERK